MKKKLTIVLSIMMMSLIIEGVASGWVLLNPAKRWFKPDSRIYPTLYYVTPTWQPVFGWAMYRWNVNSGMWHQFIDTYGSTGDVYCYVVNDPYSYPGWSTHPNTDYVYAYGPDGRPWRAIFAGTGTQVYINAATYKCACTHEGNGLIPATGWVDGQRVAMHEFGHILGLNEGNNYYSTMYLDGTTGAANVYWRQIFADDAQGVQYIYNW